MCAYFDSRGAWAQDVMRPLSEQRQVGLPGRLAEARLDHHDLIGLNVNAQHGGDAVYRRRATGACGEARELLVWVVGRMEVLLGVSEVEAVFGEGLASVLEGSEGGHREAPPGQLILLLAEEHAAHLATDVGERPAV